MVPLILTITLNPALDKLVAVPALRAGEANRVELLSTQPAGKGVDVAKVLRDMEAPVCATGFLGGAVASVFNDFLFREGIENAFVPIAGSTRTNLQIFGGDGARTELLEQGLRVYPGLALYDGTWEQPDEVVHYLEQKYGLIRL